MNCVLNEIMAGMNSMISCGIGLGCSLEMFGDDCLFVPPNYGVQWWVEMVVVGERMREGQELEEGRKLSEAAEFFF